MLKYIFIILPSILVTLTISCIGSTEKSQTISDHIQSEKESKSIEEYLAAGFKAYQSFDELNVVGVGIQTHNPFILVRHTDTLVEVLRSDELETVYQYKRLPWGWYNRIQCKYDIQGYQLDCRFDRYIYDGRVFEIERLYYPEGREFSRCFFIKDPSSCIFSSLTKTTNWDEHTVPNESIVNQESCIRYEIKIGEKKSYYISESNQGMICYRYAMNDTDLFSRSPGMDLKSISSDTYSLQNGAFINAEVMPVVDEEIVGDYILAQSGSRLRDYLEHDRVIFWLKVSKIGKIMDVILLRPKDKELEKQICHTVPVHCIPGTIAEKPVAVWYTMILRPNKH